MLLVVFAAALAVGCSGTRLAYEAAEGLDETAKVMSLHYEYLLTEAAELRESGAVRPEIITRMQGAATRATPIVLELRSLAEAYTATRSAETAAELQKAISDAAVAISNFSDAVRQR